MDVSGTMDEFDRANVAAALFNYTLKSLGPADSTAIVKIGGNDDNNGGRVWGCFGQIYGKDTAAQQVGHASVCSGSPMNSIQFLSL